MADSLPEEGAFEIDVSPIIYFFSVFLGLLEIVKYLMLEKKQKMSIEFTEQSWSEDLYGQKDKTTRK
jgi:hypothetical protein